jgi:hypothetical protein
MMYDVLKNVEDGTSIVIARMNATPKYAVYYGVHYQIRLVNILLQYLHRKPS